MARMVALANLAQAAIYAFGWFWLKDRWGTTANLAMLCAGLQLLAAGALVVGKERTARWCSVGCLALVALVVVADQAEIITKAVYLSRCWAVATEPPGRPVPGHVMLTEFLDLRFIHSVEEIPSCVVFANVLETEPVVVVERAARFGRAMLTFLVAALVHTPARLDRWFVLEVPFKI